MNKKQKEELLKKEQLEELLQKDGQDAEDNPIRIKFEWAQSNLRI